MKKVLYFLLGNCLLLSQPGNAQDLNVILRYALTSDPSLDEAKANVAAANSQTKISEAGHYPVVSVGNIGMISQNHTYDNERRSGPMVNGRLNLYSFGAVEAEVERDEHKAGYYKHKLTETREVIGQKISQLYLSALRAKENIAVFQESLQRHNKLIKDLNVIVGLDSGRESELSEAESRKNQVESSIAQQERILHTSLSQLTRYFSQRLTEKDLKDPFPSTDPEAFLQKYFNKDIATNPTYLAQQKEYDSNKAAVKAAEARRLPSINLEGSANRHDQEVYINVSWDIYNPAASYTVEQNYYSQAAAEAKLREIALDIAEKGRTAEVEMVRNKKLLTLTSKQINLQRTVVRDTEFQFKIAKKTLLNVLDAYQELTNVQIENVTARNDYRDAALLYLVAQSKVAQWAGVTKLDLPTK